MKFILALLLGCSLCLASPQENTEITDTVVTAYSYSKSQDVKILYSARYYTIEDSESVTIMVTIYKNWDASEINELKQSRRKLEYCYYESTKIVKPLPVIVNI